MDDSLLQECTDWFLRTLIRPYIISSERAPKAPPGGAITLLWRYTLEVMEALLLLPVLLVTAFPLLYCTTRGRGTAVLTVPGYLANDASLFPLRVLLNLCGFRARGWGLGQNRGNVEQMTADFMEMVKVEFARTGGRPIHLVGWSLGGVVAREVARQRPDMVASVCTLASPVVGGPSYTVAAHKWGHARTTKIAEAAAAADRDRPINVPILTVFTKRDVVVDWPACLDKYSKNVVHYEVNSKHLSIIFDPIAYWLICRWIETHMSKTL